MKAQEMKAKLDGMDELKGATIMMNRRGQVYVSGWRRAACGRDGAERILSDLGFTVSPMCADWSEPQPPRQTLREAYEQMTPEQQAEAREAWVAMGGHLQDADEEYAIKAGN